jgi:pimeloyl-ACP methyl ester carboxylesterase
VTNFLLIHGAWHCGRHWDRLAAILRAKGHTVRAPDLPGMGLDRTPLSQISLNGWAEFVVAQARAYFDTAQARGPGEKLILVGHSRGGAVISQAAELSPDRFAALVYLTAVLLPDGDPVYSLANCMPAAIAAAIRPTADGLGSTLEPTTAAEFLYNTTDAATAEWATERLCPDPTLPNTTPVALSADRYGSVPRAFIECMQDRIIPLELQRFLHERMPCAPVITLDSDHSPFLSQPEALAAALVRIVEAIKARGSAPGPR